jgi:hypothetical protein
VAGDILSYEETPEALEYRQSRNLAEESLDSNSGPPETQILSGSGDGVEA